jgi:uncharacterized membrane protein HdeD (DUF308 family)
VTGGFVRNTLTGGLEEMQASWRWTLAIGILLMVLGVICIIADVTATFITVLAFGWLLLFSGIVSLVHAFRTRTWNGFFLSLLSALLRGFTGFLLIRYPAVGAMTLTLVLASFFIVGGLFRAVGADMMKFPRWGWSVASGILSVVLGIVLLAQWPLSSVWFIGFAIGLDMIVDGAAMVGFATGMHGLPTQPPVYRPA